MDKDSVYPLRVISEEEYEKLSPAEKRLSNIQTRMAKQHAMAEVIADFIRKQKSGEATITLKSLDLTKQDRAAHRKFARETGDYIT